MASGRVLNRYRMLVTALGLQQLDVYRVMESGRPVDVIRVRDPATDKVVLINLKTTRESLTEEEFIERILEELKSQGISISERILVRLRDKLGVKAS
ncbi:MAG: hypothetical protein F7B20_02155 [Aeropyrum sp.]|nr:hypothetical protein [Aeropyrum sp.]MCE4616160.1 hypothetical protein [Aeropyrum sp.]